MRCALASNTTGRRYRLTHLRGNTMETNALTFAPMLLTMVVFVFGMACYLLPTIIAFRRSHQNRSAIAALNVLVGWTFLGWVTSLVWALTQVTNGGQLRA